MARGSKFGVRRGVHGDTLCEKPDKLAQQYQDARIALAALTAVATDIRSTDLGGCPDEDFLA